MASNPTLLTQPIATNGTKNAIPNTTTTPGKMSQDQGFPSETSLPLGAGGVAPSREDFNGAFNLLSALLYYAQKGWRFQFDATQDYYIGCIVIDTTDGNAYQALNDVSAGGSAPSADTVNWVLYAKQSAIEQQPFIPAFNKRDVITTSGTYTATVTGWYKITVKGGGGGGSGGSYTSGSAVGGGGGGEGGTSIAYEYMTAGQTASVTVGAGGDGGTASTNGNSNSGTNGGNSTVSLNLNTITGGGGKTSSVGGAGGTGTIPGMSGNGAIVVTAGTMYGRAGAGSGGGTGGNGSIAGAAGTLGGGGGGGSGQVNTVSSAGGKGGNGYAWFEYFDPTL